MKKLYLVLSLFFVTSFTFAQTNSDFVGMWKSIVKASGFKTTTPTYLVLNADGTFIWGIDSTASDPMKGTSGGTWGVTNEGEIKFIPADTSAEIRYYQLSGNNRYKYEYTEKNGKKVPVYMLEMDFYIEKISSNTEK